MYICMCTYIYVYDPSLGPSQGPVSACWESTGSDMHIYICMCTYIYVSDPSLGPSHGPVSVYWESTGSDLFVNLLFERINLNMPFFSCRQVRTEWISELF
jgi:hypothetical protein